ncbi:MAG TPA: cytochrome c [Polyangia bacterium]|jgi:mono/diheme cytochrome c family protein|nr:cytochrome c [Polyangia bacterium]
MRALRSLRSACSFAALSLALGACGGNDDTQAAIADGRAIVTANDCAGCHQESGSTQVLAGRDTPITGTQVYPSNLTPDQATGLGSWTDAQIIAAVRTGVDDEGATLCPNMPRFSTLTDTQVNHLVAYLRSIPAVSHTVPESHCPPTRP